MRKKKTKKMIGANPSLFFTIFAGEFIEISTTEKTVLTTSNEDGNVETGEYPLGIKGYLLDEDSSYYFLGRSMEAVTDAIDKKHVFTVSIMNPDEVRIPDIATPKNMDELN